MVAGLKSGDAVESWRRAEALRCCAVKTIVGKRKEMAAATSFPVLQRPGSAVRLSSLLLSSLDACRGVAVPQRGGGVDGIALGLGESAYIAIPDHGVAADGEDAIGTRVGRPGLLGYGLGSRGGCQRVGAIQSALVRSKAGTGGVTMAGRGRGKSRGIRGEVGDDRRGPPVSRAGWGVLGAAVPLSRPQAGAVLGCGGASAAVPLLGRARCWARRG